MADPSSVPWAAIGAIASPILSAALAWWAARRQDKKDKLSAEQGLIKLAQDVAKETVEELRSEVTLLRDDAAKLRAEAAQDRARIEELETALAAEKKARTKERHALANEAAIAQSAAAKAIKRAEAAERACEEAAGERRQLQQIVDSLTRLLREHGIPIPTPERSTEPVLLGVPA